MGRNGKNPQKNDQLQQSFSPSRPKTPSKAWHPSIRIPFQHLLGRGKTHIARWIQITLQPWLRATHIVLYMEKRAGHGGIANQQNVTETPKIDPLLTKPLLVFTTLFR